MIDSYQEFLIISAIINFLVLQPQRPKESLADSMSLTNCPKNLGTTLQFPKSKLS